MSAAFAALESRVNSSVFNRLSNAVATLNGTEVQGIFDNDYDAAGVGLSGMAGSTPVFKLATNLVPPSSVGLPLVVGGRTYHIVESHPDGTGLTLLMLERG